MHNSPGHRGRRGAAALTAVVGVAVVTACGSPPDPGREAVDGASASTPPRASAAPAARNAPIAVADVDRRRARPSGGTAVPAPAWLGTRTLPLRPDGFGQVARTPAPLRDRRFATVDALPPPRDETFSAAVAPVPAEAARRSTWHESCPVELAELRYVTVTFWGFDGDPHTGELIVHRDVAGDVVTVFERLHAARFPIEEMRIVAHEELDAPPTGDGNNTTAFVCRQVRGATTWSEHAYGRAVDVNPFHNPYVKDDLVLPELASAYTRRDRSRPGMIAPGDVVTTAFAGIGWGWGGDWNRSRDWMHFSRSGR